MKNRLLTPGEKDQIIHRNLQYSKELGSSYAAGRIADEASEAQDTKTASIVRAEVLKEVGKKLKENRMEEVLSSGEKSSNVKNHLWNVRLYDDELDALCKGKYPEDWEALKQGAMKK